MWTSRPTSSPTLRDALRFPRVVGVMSASPPPPPPLPDKGWDVVMGHEWPQVRAAKQKSGRTVSILFHLETSASLSTVMFRLLCFPSRNITVCTIVLYTQELPYSWLLYTANNWQAWKGAEQISLGFVVETIIRIVTSFKVQQKIGIFTWKAANNKE